VRAAIERRVVAPKHMVSPNFYTCLFDPYTTQNKKSLQKNAFLAARPIFVSLFLLNRQYFSTEHGKSKT
jgi:hypothetical protein